MATATEIGTEALPATIDDFGKRFDEALNTVSVVSFDFFDTLAQRRNLFVPKDLFLVIEPEFQQICERKDILFADVRIRAENAARRSAWAYGEEEVSLDDIYRHLGELTSLSEKVCSKLQELERQCERDALEVCEPGRSWFEKAKQASKRIIITTDTYFEPQFVMDTANKLGYDGIDTVFASSEHRATKFSGHLFQTVLDHLQCPPGEVLHVGDNSLSDGSRPTRFGIRTLLAMNPRSDFRRARGIGDGCTRNLVLSSMLSTVSEDHDRSRATQRVDAGDNLGRECLAPLYFSFAAWLAHRLQRDGYGHVVFASRDGWIMKRVFDLVREQFELDITSQYLYASRAALYPTLFFTDPKAASQVYTHSWEPITVSSAVRRIGLDYSEIRSVLAKQGVRNPAHALNSVREAVSSAFDELNEVIRSRHQAAFRNTVAYLEQEQILIDKPLAFVDIGWHGSLQGCLLALRRSRGITSRMNGYYLATSGRPDWTGDDFRSSSFLAEDGLPESIAQVIRQAPSLLEAVHSAPHGGVIGYSREANRLEPDLDRNSMELDQYQTTIAPIQEAAVKSIRSHLEATDKTTGLSPPDTQVIAKTALRFMRDPTLDEARMLGGILFASDFSADLKSLTGIGEHSLQEIEDYTLPDGSVTLWGAGLGILKNNSDIG